MTSVYVLIHGQNCYEDFKEVLGVFTSYDRALTKQRYFNNDLKEYSTCSWGDYYYLIEEYVLDE